MSAIPQDATPASFPEADGRVYDAYIAGRQSAALAAGVHAGLFDRLDEATEGLTPDQVAEAMGWSPRGARSMLVALVAMGLVTANAEQRHRLASDAAAYLVKDRPGSLAGLIELEVQSFLSPSALLEALAQNRATAYGDEDPWEAHERDPEKARKFTAAMHAISERPAAALAELLAETGELAHASRLLDVGGGSGALSIALARTHPALECVIWDLAVVGPIAEQYARAAGVSEHVRAETGDMFREPFPKGYDAVLLSQILHDWDETQGAQLLRKAHDALPPGGRILIHEKLVDDDGKGPLANALVNLDMLVWTEGQQ